MTPRADEPGSAEGAADLTYAGSGAQATVATYAAGEELWSNYFNASSVVELHGEFDGVPGKTAAARPSGSHYTWRSACMLTAQEVSAAFQPLGITVGDPQPSSEHANAACRYEQQDPSGSALDVEISMRAYDPTAFYGFAANGNWVAPTASGGAANACAAAEAVKYVNDLKAVCSTVGDSQVVFAASRLDGLVFPSGDYFYIVHFWNVSGDDRLTAPLTTLASLLATRTRLLRKPAGRAHPHRCLGR